MEIIQISQKDLNKKLFSNILFFMYAEVGAMGERGAINFVTSAGKLYHSNYVLGDIKLDSVIENFPILAKCKFSVLGCDSGALNGWNYVCLGAGNHLLVADEVYPQFKETIKDYTRRGQLYKNWKSNAFNIIKNRYSDAQEKI